MRPPLDEMTINRHIVNGICKYECFEYPQSVVKDETAEELNDQLTLLSYGGRASLTCTGKTYHFPANLFPVKAFTDQSLVEYQYNGRKYVLINANQVHGECILSNGKNIQSGSAVWIEVEPIVWLSDDYGAVITEKIIFGGIRYNDLKFTKKFDKTIIGKYMNKFFVKDIIPSAGVSAKKNYDYENKIVVQNEPIVIPEYTINSEDREIAYTFDFNDVSEEEMIEGCIKSNIAPFLHGKSSDGKSSRVKQIDPDCEIVYLRNATPDSLNGKSVYNQEKGEMVDVPPTWYKRIKDKCEKEPNKLHIVFFDELTNALPSIQGMAFNIILDKEVNGVWKLPDNCRIVAAGNDMEDSLAANEMAEPLFNRFSHVYIETTVEKWLEWAAKKENNIHPAIYAYIAYKSYSKSDVLRTTFDGKQPNADPRKWEMASKVLYATKNPEMLRSLIGIPLTEDFIQFTKHNVITLDDVLRGNYNDNDIQKMNISEKFATSIGLSKCEDKDLKLVRDFVGKLGPEVLQTFDVLCNDKEKTSNIDKCINKR